MSDSRDPQRSNTSAAAFFAAISQDLLSERDEQPTVGLICERAREVVRSAEFCGITMRRRRQRLETVASSDPLATECDVLQYELGEGPCVSSAVVNEPFLIHDTAVDERWPTWGPKVADLGVHSIISVQLSSATMGQKHEPLGAVNLYSRRRHAFDDEDVEMALIYATHAANALASSRLVSGLEVAMHSRHLIGVAQGILMQRYDLTMEQSFEALQRYSNDANIKLRDLASVVVQQRHLPDDYDEVSGVLRPG